MGRFARDAPGDEPEDEEAAGGASGSASGVGIARRGVAAAMLHAADEAEAAARLRAALEHEAQTQPESDDSSDDEDDADVAPMADDAAADDAPDARMAEFGRVMRERFLAGREDAASGVDYAAVDADASLDERWARLAAQDAEDAYFDDVE